MSEYASVVAKKYAQAFLNIAGDSFTRDDFKKVCVLERFLRQHRAELFFLRSPIKNDHAKENFLEHLMTPFSARAQLLLLVQVLMQHRRLFLLPTVARFLCQLYAERHAIAYFFIESSHELSADDCAVLEDFLARMTHETILYEYVKEPRLIAGIRLRSDRLLWEYSIHKQLKLITSSGR